MDKAVWNIKIFGVRGSTPVCDPGFQHYGGNTTCIYVDLLINDRSKMMAIFDAGTGIRTLSNEIESGKLPKVDNIYLIFTHLHWDHVQGFPFFSPAYNPNQKISIFYPKKEMGVNKLKHLFEIQTQKEFFPVQLENMGAEFTFLNDEKESHLSKTDPTVNFSYRKHQHPGGAFSYRMEAHGRSLVICTDLEHGEQLDQEVVNFCKDADWLIHDAQYTNEELAKHRGWGHSSFDQAISVAEQANVKQLIMTHHDPSHDDVFLAKIESECQNRFPKCNIAKEGMEFFI